MPVTPPPPTPPLLDNPGNVPVVIAEADPSNVTIRQLVRVAVAGKRIRLRLSNEAGSEALTLGAVHVGAAGPDGSVIAGSDRIVTFDGKNGITVPASAPLLSDPIDLKVDALEKLVISVHVPGAVLARRPQPVPVCRGRSGQSHRRRQPAQPASDAPAGAGDRSGCRSGERR